MKTPDMGYDDPIMQPKKGLLSRLFRKKKPAELEIVDDAAIDAARKEHERLTALIQKQDALKAAARLAYQEKHKTVVPIVPTRRIRPTVATATPAPTPAPAPVQEPVAPAAPVKQHVPPTIEPMEEPDLIEPAYDDMLYDSPPAMSAEELYHEVPPVTKKKLTVAPQITMKQIEEAQDVVNAATPAAKAVRLVNAVILGVAFIVGIVGVQIVYTNLPTYPMITVGIVAISVSSGIITSLAR